MKILCFIINVPFGLPYFAHLNWMMFAMHIMFVYPMSTVVIVRQFEYHEQIVNVFTMIDNYHFGLLDLGLG